MLKDILIKSSTLKKEIIIWCVSLLMAIAFNIYAIIKYKANWSELLTQLPIVLLVSVLIYLLIFVFRGITNTVLKLIKNKN